MTQHQRPIEEMQEEIVQLRQFRLDVNESIRKADLATTAQAALDPDVYNDSYRKGAAAGALAVFEALHEKENSK